MGLLALALVRVCCQLGQDHSIRALFPTCIQGVNRRPNRTQGCTLLYHCCASLLQESFRRVRARGSRRALRLLWEELNWWLMRVTWLCTEGRRDVDHPHQTAFCRARRQTSFRKGPYISSCTGQLRRPSLERSGWCFAKEHRQLEEPISAEERQGCVTKFFAEEVRIQPLGAG